MSDSPKTSRYAGLMGGEVERGTFLAGAVVQVVAGDPATGYATVVEVHPADIVVTSERLVAVDGDLEWSWILADVEHVAHGVDEPWTVIAVPGVGDHGVTVRPVDVAGFRSLITSSSGDRASSLAQDPVVDLTRMEALPAAAAPSPAVGESLLEPGPQLEGEAEVDPPPPSHLPIVARSELESIEPESDWAGLPPPPAWAPGADLTTMTPVVVEGASTSLGTPPSPTGTPGGLRTVPGGRKRAARAATRREALPLVGLEAREISAWFGSHHVLDRVSLDMTAGKVTALIGPSGCGKSTFLRILNRMHELIATASLSGEVLLDGEDIYDVDKKLTDARRQIGMVFQKPNPFPAMSIYDNVIASFRLTGLQVGADEKDEVVESCLTKAGLWNEVRDRLRMPGGGLSGGQQQRLCIARALAIRPRVLLMDEPCSALDPTSTRRIEQTITELASEVTIVIVTHNMQQAARVSDQCAFFLAEQGTPGVIVEHGPTDAMFERPQDPRTHDYVNGRFG